MNNDPIELIIQEAKTRQGESLLSQLDQLEKEVNSLVKFLDKCGGYKKFNQSLATIRTVRQILSEAEQQLSPQDGGSVDSLLDSSLEGKDEHYHS